MRAKVGIEAGLQVPRTSGRAGNVREKKWQSGRRSGPKEGTYCLEGESFGKKDKTTCRADAAPSRNGLRPAGVTHKNVATHDEFPEFRLKEWSQPSFDHPILYLAFHAVLAKSRSAEARAGSVELEAHSKAPARDGFTLWIMRNLDDSRQQPTFAAAWTEALALPRLPESRTASVDRFRFAVAGRSPFRSPARHQERSVSTRWLSVLRQLSTDPTDDKAPSKRRS